MNSENIAPVVRTGAGPDAQRVSSSQGSSDQRRRAPARARKLRPAETLPAEDQAGSASVAAGASGGAADEDGAEPTHVDVRA